MNLLVNSNFKIASPSLDEFFKNYYPYVNRKNKNYDKNNKKMMEIVEKLQKNNKIALKDENRFQIFRTRLLLHNKKHDEYLNRNKTHKNNHKNEKIIGVNFSN